ncbi:MAG TPA: ATP-binding cassette domain-containing protein [Balneolaceae bacterium]|nr:ATP-binding cassette domain-containing protein [Balneolaceae bacterium]
MITLENVTKVFGSTTAVDEISFKVEKGETFGLVGTSGCGKTTTLRMINRLIEPTSGSIAIDGKKTTAQNPEELRRQIGYVIQNVGLFPHYSVQENIATVPGLLNWETQRIQSRSEELLQLVGLDPETYADREPSSLSGGQQQRVGLARALAADPPIILMDEPFGALDPITKQQIREEVGQLLEQIHKTIVLVTHDVFEAFEMCDRLCLLDQGKIQQIGTPKELLFQPANDFVESFFASNRFQLELMSITLHDILKSAEEEMELYWSPPLRDKKERIDSRESLYVILEEIEKAKEQNPVIIQRINGRVRESLGFSALLNRFQQYKLQMKSGGRHV